MLSGVFVCGKVESHITRKASEGGWNQYTHIHPSMVAICMRTTANQPCVFFPSLFLCHCHTAVVVAAVAATADGHSFCLAGEILRFEWNGTSTSNSMQQTDGHLYRAYTLSSVLFVCVRACVCSCPCPCVCVGGVEICRSESKIQVHVVHDFILVHNVADLKTLLFIFTWMLKVFTHKCCGARWLAFIAGVVCSPFGCAHIPRKRLF